MWRQNGDTVLEDVTLADRAERIGGMRVGIDAVVQQDTVGEVAVQVTAEQRRREQQRHAPQRSRDQQRTDAGGLRRARGEAPADREPGDAEQRDPAVEDDAARGHVRVVEPPHRLVAQQVRTRQRHGERAGATQRNPGDSESAHDRTS